MFPSFENKKNYLKNENESEIKNEHFLSNLHFFVTVPIFNSENDGYPLALKKIPMHILEVHTYENLIFNAKHGVLLIQQSICGCLNMASTAIGGLLMTWCDFRGKFKGIFNDYKL